MEKWHGKVAIVTGASSGIGAATVRALATRGLKVVALARREDRLQDLATELSKVKGSGKVYPKKTDLRKEDEVLAAFDWVDKELGGADILVNNAGILPTQSYLSEGSLEEWKAVMDVNVLAVAHCTKLFLNSMERRDNHMGHIVIINSIAGHSADISKVAMYTASKHAVTAISKCLRRELAEKNSTIKVTSISPGLTLSEILKDVKAISNFAILECSDVAEAVINALSASPVSELCEIVLNPVPTKVAIY